MSNWLKSIVVYTDGACSGNPGPGGWASIVAFPEGHVRELGGKEAPTTNNQMELMGTIRALDLIKDRDEPVVIFTDSTYVIRGITQWVWGWKKRGWKNAEGQEVLNRDLWERLHRLVLARKEGKVEWKYIRGHTGNPGNERCDEIAVQFSKGRWIELYDGPLVGYGVAIHDFPEDVPLPEMRPKVEKKAAYSYLSNVNGETMRHRDWASCEKRVKGQSGAKFKKAGTPAEEAGILSDWGVDPSRVKGD
ncbi:MAG: ribonuclease HI [Bdellovibrionaceae bacterium]|nr:ribonuclease HI [Pseudobdellovibrionaceae bacterium]